MPKCIASPFPHPCFRNDINSTTQNFNHPCFNYAHLHVLSHTLSTLKARAYLYFAPIKARLVKRPWSGAL